MSTERPSYASTRIWTRTVRTLRPVHAITGEGIVCLSDRLADAEVTRLLSQAREHTRGGRAQDV